jgi:hypothetical protein
LGANPPAGRLPARPAAPNRNPNPFHNPALGAAERVRADAAFGRGAPQPAAQRNGRLLDQIERPAANQRLARANHHWLQNVMYLLAALVLAVLILLTSRTNPPPSQVMQYAPRNNEVSQSVPPPVNSAAPLTNQLALQPAFTSIRGLIHTCPRAECVPIDSQPIIESNEAVVVRARSADGRWLAISAPDLRWNGWVPSGMVRLANPNAMLPVLPG